MGTSESPPPEQPAAPPSSRRKLGSAVVATLVLILAIAVPVSRNRRGTSSNDSSLSTNNTTTSKVEFLSLFNWTLPSNSWYIFGGSGFSASPGFSSVITPVSSNDNTNIQLSLLPSHVPSEGPTESPTQAPVTPTNPPTPPPTDAPTPQPTPAPTPNPTKAPTRKPTESPTLTTATYAPGNLVVSQNGLLLSQGLSSRILAQSGERVDYDNGGRSAIDCHDLPDMGATFANDDGGYIYVSNSEVRDATFDGGVGAFRFDANGNLFDYRMILENTRSNCGGGRTPWGAWISCEEFPNGRIWQTDPKGEREATTITMGDGVERGLFESFAYDVRDRDEPQFFATEDHNQGRLRRFIPNNPDWSDPWNMLTGGGQMSYLLLEPNSDGRGRFSWTTDRDEADQNAGTYYPNSEGIDILDENLYFVSKVFKTLFVLNLDTGFYVNQTTKRGLFNDQPDQLQRILADDDSEELLYFTEDGPRNAGIHGRSKSGRYFTILEGATLTGETTGLAFSPDGMKMYFAFQGPGTIFGTYSQHEQQWTSTSLIESHTSVDRGLERRWTTLSREISQRQVPQRVACYILFIDRGFENLCGKQCLNLGRRVREKGDVVVASLATRRNGFMKLGVELANSLGNLLLGLSSESDVGYLFQGRQRRGVQ